MVDTRAVVSDSFQHLNYNHLRCFWAVAKEGSVAGACTLLGLTQPTISKQVSDLEETLGERLFDRTGRRLVSTSLGRTVFAYADDIFSLGQELLDVVRGQATHRPVRLHVGISDVVPKLLTRLVLEPALCADQPMRLVCREGKTEHLLADLALSGLDVLLTDAPLEPGSRIKAFNHKLGESPVGVFGAPQLAAEHAGAFPGSLHGAPLLMPMASSAIRRSIERWLDANSIRPRIVAEFEDTALLKSFGEAGHGLFFAPMVVGDQIRAQLGVELCGEVGEVSEPLYAVTVERRVSHPGVSVIIEAAKRTIAAAV